MALATLQGNAVVIFFDGRNMSPVPALIHAQYHLADDTGLKPGASWISPKVVFCDPDITKTLGRVSYTQMKADRDIALNSALQTLRNTPNALAPAPQSPAAASSAPLQRGDTVAPPSDTLDLAAVAACFVLAFMILWIFSAARRH